MVNFSVKMLALVMLGLIPACFHTMDERKKSDFEETADDRIDGMEKNIKRLEKQADQQVSGEGREKLHAAISELKQHTSVAKAELKEMEDRDVKTWTDKKSSVDDALYNMDKSYNDALTVSQAH
ncbi:MAG: hypothetical protein AB7T49_18325 [Oligoflexales bacterium]